MRMPPSSTLPCWEIKSPTLEEVLFLPWQIRRRQTKVCEIIWLSLAEEGRERRRWPPKFSLSCKYCDPQTWESQSQVGGLFSQHPKGGKKSKKEGFFLSCSRNFSGGESDTTSCSVFFLDWHCFPMWEKKPLKVSPPPPFTQLAVWTHSAAVGQQSQPFFFAHNIFPPEWKRREKPDGSRDPSSGKGDTISDFFFTSNGNGIRQLSLIKKSKKRLSGL